MNFRTIDRDCLFLNWVAPASSLGELAPPLRYDVMTHEGTDFAFVSTVLFRQQVLDIPRVHFPTVSYPQLSVRLCVQDDEGVPSFLVKRLFFPAWVMPSALLLARHQARLGTFHYPALAEPATDESELRWQVKGKGELDIAATIGAPMNAGVPSLGGWERTVLYFEQRTRWYFSTADGLKRLERTGERAPAVPVKSRVIESSLLEGVLFPQAPDGRLEIHSAWLNSERSFIFEIGRSRGETLPEGLPAPG